VILITFLFDFGLCMNPIKVITICRTAKNDTYLIEHFLAKMLNIKYSDE